MTKASTISCMLLQVECNHIAISGVQAHTKVVTHVSVGNFAEGTSQHPYCIAYKLAVRFSQMRRFCNYVGMNEDTINGQMNIQK